MQKKKDRECHLTKRTDKAEVGGNKCDEGCSRVAHIHVHLTAVIMSLQLIHWSPSSDDDTSTFTIPVVLKL